MPVIEAAGESLHPEANCYAVPGIPGLTAGEYPGARHRQDALVKLHTFKAAGISAFIDLTEDREELRPYAVLIPEVWPDPATRPLHFRLPVRDLGVPLQPELMRAILDTIDTVLAQGHRAYVHCWGGVGRTGTVVGCCLVRRGLDGDAALQQVQALFAGTRKGRRTGRRSPETPEQGHYVRSWALHERRRAEPVQPVAGGAPLRDIVGRLRPGDPVVHRGLAMVPLFGDVPRRVEYLTFGEAVRAGTCRVTEMSEGGSVPQLMLVNSGALPVLLLDGEELLGAKQNRIVNLTILAPAMRNLAIPVSCVEMGRWQYQSREFGESPRTMYPHARAAKMAQVSASLDRGERHADQGAVWSEIAAKAERMAAPSATSAMSDIFVRHGETIEEYAGQFAAQDGQVGAVFVIGRRAVGLDLFDAPATLRTYLPKLIRGYALDALDAELGRGGTMRAGGGVSIALAERFLGALAECGAQTYPAVGLGQDLRLRGDGLTGAALQVEETFVHLGAFDVGQHRRH
ncbi:MAG TPA: DUF6569 family protein [Gemmatimonadales bacterium]|nr:DUF6569 family protein [Gemmatimonadales bacterium]